MTHMSHARRETSRQDRILMGFATKTPPVATAGNVRPARQPTRKTPHSGERGASMRNLSQALAFGGEHSAFGLLETGFLSLRVDLPQDGTIERGVRRLTTGAGPELLCRHRVDQLLGVHRLLRTGQHLGRRVDRAQFLGGVTLRPSRGSLRCGRLLRGCLLCRRGLRGLGSAGRLSGGLLGRGLLRCHGLDPRVTRSRWLGCHHQATGTTPPRRPRGRFGFSRRSPRLASIRSSAACLQR